MSRRPGRRFSRRGLGGAGGGFAPNDLLGLVLWLRSDMGITTVNAAVSQPNDVSNAAWTKSNCTTPNAQTILDTNDGAPAVHVIFQAVPNLQVNHTATVSFEAKAGTIGFIRGQDSAGALAVAVNLTTGAVVVGGAAVTVTAMADSWWKISITDTCANAAYNIGPCAAGGGYSYQGNGTGSVLVRNIAVDQKNISAWADQSGAGNHLLQATAAKQPLFKANGGRGYPAAWFDAVNDFMAGGANYAQPNTVFAVATNEGSSAAYRTLFDGGGSNTRLLRVDITTQTIVANAGTALSDSTWPTNETHVAAAVFNGVSSSVIKDGASTSGNAGAGAGTGFSIGALADGVTNPWLGPIYEHIAFNRVLTASEIQAVNRYLGTRYGVTVS